MRDIYNKICISIMPKDLRDLHNILDEIPSEPMIEVRLDNFNDFDRFKDQYPRKLLKRTIFTIRTYMEGGSYIGPPDELYHKYVNLVDLQPLYIDIGLDTGITERIVGYAMKKGVGIIVSYHNIEYTPDMDELERIYNRILNYDPDVIKVVCRTREREDNCRIIEFLLRHLEGPPLIAFNMGIKGIETRYISIILGGYITYTSYKNYYTAPGQTSYHEFIRKLEEVYGDG